MKVQIMAIGNVTPDSFYASSRLRSIDQVITWAHDAVEAGASILDIGGCSTRPGSIPASEEEEWERLEPALAAIRKAMPETQLSVDTFRVEIARRVLEQFGPVIINDISGGNEVMYELVERYRVPYIFTFCGDYERLRIVEERPEIDWILDPGFGFIGSTEADYACMKRIDELKRYNRPILVGVSRKSMVWRPLGITPETSLSATQALHFYALEHGATILRVHDVREAAQTIALATKLEILDWRF